MNIKLFFMSAVFLLLITSLTLFGLGCKEDSAPTTPPGGTSTAYGSGTLTTTSVAGSLSFTGTGVWPPQAGPSVLAMYDTSGGFGVFLMGGYQQVSGPNYDIVALAVFVPAGVAAGTYSYPDSFGFGAIYNAPSFTDTTYADSGYSAVSGSLVISSATGQNASGTYSVMARKGTAQPIQFTGTFNVAYVVGVWPEWATQPNTPRRSAETQRPGIRASRIKR